MHHFQTKKIRPDCVPLRKPATAIMARSPSPQSLESDPPVLEVAALIDVCFLLLIYFLVTSTILPREQELRQGLATHESSEREPARIEPMLIGVESSGLVHSGMGTGRQDLDADPTLRELPLLKTHLELYLAATRASGATPMIRLNADDGATQQRVIDVLDTLEQLGIRKVAFVDPVFR